MKTYEINDGILNYEITFEFNGLVINDDSFDVSNVVLTYIKLNIFHPDGSFIQTTYFDSIDEVPDKYKNEFMQYYDECFDEYVDDVNNQISSEEYYAD